VKGRLAVGPLSKIRIDVIDNGGQWTHREWRVLRYIGAETKIIPNTTPLEEIEADGLVLSGGAPRVGFQPDLLGRCSDYIDNGEIPLLAICVGLQFFALYLDGEVGSSGAPEFGRTEIEVIEEDTILKGLPDHFVAWTSHNDHVMRLPDGFRSIARSKHCEVQAAAHDTKPWFGTQFHPEVEQTEHGYEIFTNYKEFVAEYRGS
jgi:GMP synthase (glutamine-hydrolysing)